MATVSSVGIFTDNATSYIWAADSKTVLSDTITLGKVVYPRQPNVEVGLWTLVLKATSAQQVTILPKVEFLLDEGELLYSNIVHPIEGYSTNSPSTKVTSFDSLGGDCFEANLSAWQTFWLYTDGLRINIYRSSNIAITFNYGAVKII